MEGLSFGGNNQSSLDYNLTRYHVNFDVHRIFLKQSAVYLFLEIMSQLLKKKQAL